MIILRIIAVLSMFFIYTKHASGYDRIVVLYGAVSPILKELGAGDKVVGVTRTDPVFKRVIKVGSHLKPNTELINALRPDLIIAGSKRAFPEDMEVKVRAEVFHYDPRSLEEILDKIIELGAIVGKAKEADRLTSSLRRMLSSVIMPSKRPTVIYEISARPLRVAGSRSIITSIIERAGGINLIRVQRRHVLISPEMVLKLNPDFYIYQIGPMNKNPEPPQKRGAFKRLQSRVISVDEFEFARPGINAFDAVLRLNKIFRKYIGE